MRRRPSSLGPLLCLLLASCGGGAQFAPSRKKDRYAPRRPAIEVEVLRLQPPDRPYREIGTVAVCCLTLEPSLERLRRKAASAGGDAIMAIDAQPSKLTTATVVRYEPPGGGAP